MNKKKSRNKIGHNRVYRKNKKQRCSGESAEYYIRIQTCHNVYHIIAL